MKKIYSLLLLSTLLLLGASNAWASGVHTFDGTEKLYFRNITTTNLSGAMWKHSDGNVYAYFFYEPSGGSKQEAWAAAPAQLEYGTANAEGAIYSITVPAGTWEKLILTRGTASGWSGKWAGDANQTYDIVLYDDEFSRTYIVSFDDKNASGTLAWAAAPFCLTGIGDDWDLYKNPFNSDNQVTVELTAGWISFKVTSIYNASGSATWYGKGTSSSILTPVATSVSGLNYSDNDGNPANVMVHAVVPGEYTFTWDDKTKTISVAYPSSYSRSSLTTGGWGTICLPVGISSVSGATLYEIHSYNAAGDGIILAEVDSYTAGNPYFFKLGAESDAISIALDNSTYDESANTVNGLVGTYTNIEINEDGEATDLYVLSSGLLKKAATKCAVGANKAYVNRSSSIGSPIPSYVTPAPGRNYVEVPLAPNAGTDLNAINASEEVVKFFQNGKLFIQKNGVVYDMMGTIVK